MINVSELQERFSQVESAINRAAEMCLADSSVPKAVKDWMEKFDSEADQVSMILETRDEGRILQCMDDLEEIGDHAKEVCQRASNMKPSVMQAVLQAHDQLSQLKHQLH